MAARRKQEAVSIPANRAEAEALVRDYARLEHEAGHVRGIADKIIADAKASRDASLAVIDGKQAAIFAQLKGWWEATGKDEAKGRILDIDGTQIGMRKTMPKLGFLNKMKEADVLAWLSGLRWSNASKFIRVKRELDKHAIIKALTDAKAEKSVISTLSKNCKVTQKDEFFVKVAPLEKPVVEGKKS